MESFIERSMLRESGVSVPDGLVSSSVWYTSAMIPFAHRCSVRNEPYTTALAHHDLHDIQGSGTHSIPARLLVLERIHTPPHRFGQLRIELHQLRLQPPQDLGTLNCRPHERTQPPPPPIQHVRDPPAEHHEAHEVHKGRRLRLLVRRSGVVRARGIRDKVVVARERDFDDLFGDGGRPAVGEGKDAVLGGALGQVGMGSEDAP
jgi:hypothetical protein